MPQELSLLGWSATGLRCPDHSVALGGNGSEPHKIALIQMPNGTGKTTTLKMLRAALSGSARYWSTKEVASFRTPGDDSERGEFIVELIVDDMRLTIELELDFLEGRAIYRTTHGSGGIRDGFKPPLGLRSFLTPEFVELFVFDGELAHRLLDPRHTKAQQAVDALFQLSLLDNLSDEFDKNWEKHADSVSGKGKKALVRRKNRWDTLRKHLRSLQKRKKECDRELEPLKKAQLRMETGVEKLVSRNTTDAEELTETKERQAAVQAKVELLSGQLVDKMREPEDLLASFRSELLVLKGSLDTLKLPRSTSREFFLELAAAEECVCGRPMTAQARRFVEEGAEDYLAEDAVGVLNSMKGDISTRCSKEAEVDAVSLAETLADLRDAASDLILYKNQLRALQDRRIREGDSALESLRAKLDGTKEEIGVVSAQLENLDAKPTGKESDKSESIAAIEKLCRKARDDYAEITETLELRAKTQAVRSILERAREDSCRDLGVLVIDKTNELLEQLLPREQVSVSSIDKSVRLTGQEAGSMGQTLAVGYAFLATLFLDEALFLVVFFLPPSPLLRDSRLST